MNEYRITYDTTEGNAQLTIIERSEATARRAFKANHKGAEISDIELIDGDVSATKDQERETLEGFYVTNARVMSPDGSDYRYIEDVRVVNKIVREVRKAGLPLLQEDIDVEDTQGELERRAKYMEAPLDEMVRAKEISSAQITVPEGQDIIKDERMDVVVRYVSRGYIRTIHVDIGRANATS